MKIGSIVECVRPFPGNKNAKTLSKGYYTVRGFNKTGEGVLVEEIINNEGWFRNPLTDQVCFGEPGYNKNRFREIEFSPSLMEEIEECLTQPVEALK